MKLIGFCLIFWLAPFAGRTQDFIQQYRLFWASRYAKEAKPDAIIPHGKASVRVSRLKGSSYTLQREKIDSLQSVLQDYQWQTGVDLAKNELLYLLIFTDPRTSTERIYLWDKVHKLYYEQVEKISPVSTSQLTIIRKNSPAQQLTPGHEIVMKDDTLRVLLEQRKLKEMYQLAQTHRLEGGETCLGLIYKKEGTVCKLTPIDLPSFEFIQSK
ncbi:hypothetical protein [Spirosoma gilvum]